MFNDYESLIDKQESEINSLRTKIKLISEGSNDNDQMKLNKAKYQTEILELKEKIEFFEIQLDQKQSALKQFLEQNMEYFNNLKNMEESYPIKLKNLTQKEELITDSMKEFQKLKDNSLKELEQREIEIAKRESQLLELHKQISNKYDSLDNLARNDSNT